MERLTLSNYTFGSSTEYKLVEVSAKGPNGKVYAYAPDPSKKFHGFSGSMFMDMPISENFSAPSAIGFSKYSAYMQSTIWTVEYDKDIDTAANQLRPKFGVMIRAPLPLLGKKVLVRITLAIEPYMATLHKLKFDTGALDVVTRNLQPAGKVISSSGWFSAGEIDGDVTCETVYAIYLHPTTENDAYLYVTVKLFENGTLPGNTTDAKYRLFGNVVAAWYDCTGLASQGLLARCAE